MTFRSVLVEYEDVEEKAVYASSGTLFGHKYVLVTANSLTSLIKKEGFMKKIAEVEAGVLHQNIFPPKRSLLNVIMGGDGKFVSHRAAITNYFLCKNIKGSSRKILTDWQIDSPDEKDLNKDLLGLFFVLEIDKDAARDGRTLTSAMRDLFFENETSEQVYTGRSVCIDSTPFGNRNFLNSFSQGIVSNVLGENECFILSDCPTVPGSEGSPMYIKNNEHKKNLVGIVLACLSWWKGEWIGLTLAVNISPLLDQFLEVKRGIIAGCNSENRLTRTVSKSLFQIVCGSSWGTGILVDAKSGTILTNSHVVDISRPIWAHSKRSKLQAELIFSSDEDAIYDLAVLKCDPQGIRKLGMEEIRVSLKQLRIGDSVYSAGYSLFSVHVGAQPTLTKGHVSQMHVSMLKTTCCVHPGASGGAILRQNGELAAVIVCNTRLEDNGVIYPRVNMAIPITAVYPTIEKYLKNGDKNVLKELQTNDTNLSKPWKLLEGKL